MISIRVWLVHFFICTWIMVNFNLISHLKLVDFGFDRTRHNILQVNKSSYEQCIDNDFIFNVTRGGRDVFQLLQPKPYYFICGRGYCLKGMKLSVNVLPQPPPSTSTVPIIPASTANTLIIDSDAFTAIATTILTVFIFKALYFD